MKVGVIADTHNHVARTKRAMDIFVANGCEVLLHCGDLANPAILAICRQLPFHFVLGNHDDEATFRLDSHIDGVTCHGELMDLSFDSVRFMMTHGHLKSLVRAIHVAKPDYFLCGHSHVACDRMENGVRKVNPGALFRIKTPSVAIIDTLDGTVEFELVPK
ncbi:MAG: metallophosphoesterase family protein [Fuerstiella sp.]